MKNKLLIIDTERFDRDIMVKIFKGKYVLSFAHNEETCERACQEYRPDVTLYEMREPQESHLSLVCESIRSVNPDIPLIVIASYNTIELERYARMQGVFYYLIRPFNLKELWDVLDAAFVKAFECSRHLALKAG
jgi:DNA-binding NtrC family response regulator